MEEIKNVMKDKFEERFNVSLKTGSLTEKEKELTILFCRSITHMNGSIVDV